MSVQSVTTPPERSASELQESLGIKSRSFSDRFWWMAPVLASVIMLAVVFIKEESFAFVATSWIIFGIVGLSLDLVWGKSGLLSLGQTALFGIGGYVGAIAAINLSDITGNTLVWAVPFGAGAGALAALLLGWLMFYANMGNLQRTILTYTSTLLLLTLMVSFTATFGDAVVGGTNGLGSIPSYVLGFGEGAERVSSRVMFVTVVVIACSILLATIRLMRSPFGTVIDCIRLDVTKADLLGFDTRQYQLRLFVLSGAIAGVGGGLFVLWANFVNPSIFSNQNALFIPIYVLVGGNGTLFGGFVGAIAVGWLSFWLGGGAGGGQTTLVLGVLLILLVRFNRSGLFGIAASVWRRLRPKETTVVKSEPVKVDFELLQRLREGQTKPSEISLVTNDASKSFGGVKPVDEVSQRFTPGSVHCVIGPNGAGKSSYLKVCTGAYKPDSGSVSINGVDVTSTDPHKRVALGLGVKNQKAQVFAELDVRTNLWVAAYSRSRNSDHADSTVDAMLQMLGMTKGADRLAGDLSHGEQQWLDIGMVLCLAPDVILLDEPAAGMTGEEREQLAALVRALTETAAVVVVEHDMGFIQSLDPEVTVLHQGAVFTQGDIEEVRSDERVLDIYLGRREHVRDN